MDTRSFLARRRREPIRIPSRPVVGAPTSSSILVSSEWVAGSGGSAAGFVTDLRLQNLENRTVEARIFFAPASGAAVSQVRRSLSPLESAELADVLGEWFATSGTGTLTLETADRTATVAMSARTYLRDGGSVPFVEGISLAGRPGAQRFAAGVSETGAFSTELEAFNATKAPELFGVRLRAADGSVVGVREALFVGPGEEKQWSLRELFPEASGDAMTAELFAASGSSLPTVRAAVTDLRTGSRVRFPADRAASRVYLPVNGRTAGSGDTFLASDATFSNSGSLPLTVRVRFLEDDRDNTSALVATLLLGPGQALPVQDVLGTLFGMREVGGFLEASSERAELVVAARQTARSEGAAGSVGAAIASVTPERFSIRSLLVPAAPGRALSASRVGLLNPDAAPLPAVIRWLDSMGEVVAETAVVVPGRGVIEVAADAAATQQGSAVLVDSDRPHFAFLLDHTRLLPGEVTPRELVARAR